MEGVEGAGDPTPLQSNLLQSTTLSTIGLQVFESFCLGLLDKQLLLSSKITTSPSLLEAGIHSGASFLK